MIPQDYRPLPLGVGHPLIKLRQGKGGKAMQGARDEQQGGAESSWAEQPPWHVPDPTYLPHAVG
jgi:hypothetical protein